MLTSEPMTLPPVSNLTRLAAAANFLARALAKWGLSLNLRVLWIAAIVADEMNFLCSLMRVLLSHFDFCAPLSLRAATSLGKGADCWLLHGKI